MTVDDLRRAVASVPDPSPLPPIDEELVASSVRYLGSSAAMESLEADAYWPKWDSPWWHMLLLSEIDEARRIPAAMVYAMVARLDPMPLHVFPIYPGEAPPGTDPWRDVICHCALGSMQGQQTLSTGDILAVEYVHARTQDGAGALAGLQGSGNGARYADIQDFGMVAQQEFEQAPEIPRRRLRCAHDLIAVAQQGIKPLRRQRHLVEIVGAPCIDAHRHHMQGKPLQRIAGQIRGRIHHDRNRSIGLHRTLLCVHVIRLGCAHFAE